MKFKIKTLKQAVNGVEYRTSAFNEIMRTFETMIHDKVLSEETLMRYLHSFTRVIHAEETEQRDIELVEQFDVRLRRVITRGQIVESACKDFFFVISEAIFKSRYEVIDGREIIGAELELEEICHERFDERAWLKKHQIIF